MVHYIAYIYIWAIYIGLGHFKSVSLKVAEKQGIKYSFNSCQNFAFSNQLPCSEGWKSGLNYGNKSDPLSRCTLLQCMNIVLVSVLTHLLNNSSATLSKQKHYSSWMPRINKIPFSPLWFRFYIQRFLLDIFPSKILI